jgi:hypothetical protein
MIAQLKTRQVIEDTEIENYEIIVLQQINLQPDGPENSDIVEKLPSLIEVRNSSFDPLHRLKIQMIYVQI